MDLDENSLDSESLQRVSASEEVDDEQTTSEDEQDFDISLAASHSYMGGGLSSVRGRVVLEAGWEGRVPVVAHHGAVFPGETVPMLVSNAHDAAIVQKIKDDKLFGLLCPDGDNGAAVSGYGALCEVYEAALGGAAEPAALSFKARATHRFRFCHMPKSSVPIHLYARSRRGLRYVDAALTAWPAFVYDMFDYERMRNIIKAYFDTLMLDALPEGAVSLSYWVASNLTLGARDRLALFAVDDALLRLHLEVRFITQFSRAQKCALCCGSCGGEVAQREHVFPMSSHGVHSNYTNPGGYVHGVVTVTRARAAPGGPPSADYSWFPGYSWTVALCRDCRAHVGWRFDAIKRSLRPQQFYGLCRNYVQPRHHDQDLADY
ncbi:protein cereblon isoform X2 [Bombyx mori]|uniref:CULT domain-containing protein n=1 Tax=Bombyx mori TaxID=7091 RepID=A0A8R2C4T5_BOMMO|nr:protein cereblon isoform X2 [Bombyx mori]